MCTIRKAPALIAAGRGPITVPGNSGERVMRKQVVDHEFRFECGSCAACCRQPWLIRVEEEKCGPIEGFDWGAKYGQLVGREPLARAQVTGGEVPVLAKKDNGECVFLDADRLCIIHKELGYEAKPLICRRFPYYGAPMPDVDHLSANFGCPAVQAGRGPTMEEKRQDILSTMPASKASAGGFSDVALLVGHLIPLEAANVLADHWADLFDPETSEDLWSRFAAALRITTAAVRAEPAALPATLGEESFGDEVELPALEPAESPAAVPWPCRLLLALDLWNDYYPPGHSGARRPPLTTRLGLIGKVMHVVRMNGAYASRYLPGNIVLHRLGAASFRAALPPDESTRLLCRWIRAGFRQRSFRRDRISMMAGLHQQIVDANAVHFYGRALADQAGRERPLAADYSRALNIVGFGISTQKRAYQTVFRKRAMSLLESVEMAWCSLGMFYPTVLAAGASSRPPCASAGG